MRRPPKRSIFSLIVVFGVIAAVGPLIAVLPGLVAAARTQVGVRATDTLIAGGQQIASRIARGLSEQWREHQAMAAYAVADGIGGAFPIRIDTAMALNDRLSWMGMVAPNGRVVVATGRVLEGQDLSGRSWFRDGLQGLFAGQVQEGARSQRLRVPSEGGEPLRQIGFAAPVRRADGTLLGVLGSHVEWNWVRDLVRNAPLPVGSDAMLVSRDGVVLVGPPGLEGQRLDLRTTIAASQGLIVTQQEQWPDGLLYLSATVPTTVEAGRPAFGWGVVVRQAPNAAFDAARALAVAVLAPMLLVAVVILAAGLVLARCLGRPFASLAEAAAALAEGTSDRPVPESRATREAAVLSAALARLDRPAKARPAIVLAAAQ